MDPNHVMQIWVSRAKLFSVPRPDKGGSTPLKTSVLRPSLSNHLSKGHGPMKEGPTNYIDKTKPRTTINHVNDTHEKETKKPNQDGTQVYEPHLNALSCTHLPHR